MNRLIVCSLLLFGWPALAANGHQGDDPKWCRVCHRSSVFSTKGMGQSVHADLTCQDCHSGYHFNPHEPVEEASGDEVDAVRVYGSKAPAALASCHECHDIGDGPGAVAHGHSRKADAAAMPYCLDCHGDPHVIPVSSTLTKTERRQTTNAACIGCHQDEARMKKVGLSTKAVRTYEHSMHFRKLTLGSLQAPGCADCHGGHEQRDLRTAPVTACKSCHEAAAPAFATLASHRPFTAEGRPVGYFTERFFAWLTFITILFLLGHIALDLLASLRAWLRSGHQEN